MSTAAKTLVVVESPAKAKTIKKYLGPNYEVLASKGHIKDLPKKLGVDVEKDFAETYEVIEGKAKVLAELKGAAKNAGEILLATDPDREGEAIAWHVAEELRRPKIPIKRVEFHEITKKGVEHGVNNPRALDDHLYDAQRARRVLDRIVGYDVSALVWSKLAFGLSAGRVQSVALRLIVDREREIDAFVPSEYWNVGVSLVGKKRPTFVARLVTREGEKYEVKDGATAAVVKDHLTAATYTAARISKREQKRHAPAPYTTSKLQQDATSYLRFTTKRTMQIAQGLYEGVDLGKDGGPVGLITYMRTDSVRVSEDAIAAARETIATHFGADHLPEKPNYYKSKKNAQDAHEAIRPTSMELSPEAVRKHLKDEQFKLYKLIWDRFVASQMAVALYDQTSVDIEAVAPSKDGADVGDAGGRGVAVRKYGLRASGRTLKFGGWLEAYGKGLLAPLAGEEDEVEGAGTDAIAGAADDSGLAGQSEPVESQGASADGARGPKCRCSSPRPRRRFPSLARENRFASWRRPASWPSRSSRSLPRATTKARWCVSSRSVASVGRARTPRSSARSKRATTSRSSHREGSSRRCSASS